MDPRAVRLAARLVRGQAEGGPDVRGYGYLWWVAPNGGPHFTSAYFNGRVFSAQGFGGHYIVVVPYLDLVVVHRVNTDMPGRFVTGSQFGRLMQLILDARK